MSHSTRKLTRRSLLVRSAQAATAMAVASDLAPLFAAPKSRWFKIGACEWSLGKSDWTSFEVAKEIGVDGIQISMGRLSNGVHLLQPSVQKKYLAAAKQTGLEIASMALTEMNSVPLKSDPRAAKWLDQSIDICKALGITISMPACFGKGDLDMSKTKEIDHLVGVLKEVAPRAEKEGILLGLENYLSAEDNMKIIDRVGSSAVRVYYDVGNSTDKGRDILKEIRLLGSLICEFHAKDSKFLLGKGRIDFHKVRQAMDDIAFSGWIQLEAARVGGLISAYRTNYKYLKSIFPAKG